MKYKLIFSLVVPGRLPSWNEVMRMHRWAQHSLTERTQQDFLSALLAIASASSTKTTCAKKQSLIAYGTLESCLAMRREQRELRRLKKKSAKAKPKKR